MHKGHVLLLFLFVLLLLLLLLLWLLFMCMFSMNCGRSLIIELVAIKHKINFRTAGR